MNAQLGHIRLWFRWNGRREYTAYRNDNSATGRSALCGSDGTVLVFPTEEAARVALDRPYQTIGEYLAARRQGGPT